MSRRGEHHTKFPSARDESEALAKLRESALHDTPQTRSSAYELSFADEQFLLRDELRPVRLQLELLKPEILQAESRIRSTVVIFGSARIHDAEEATRRLDAAREKLEASPEDPELQRDVRVAQSLRAKTRYYDEARKLASMISTRCQSDEGCDLVVVTGGGPGIMEAGNRGADDVQAKSIGLNIVLPHEQAPNPYISPELCFQFHYFAVRKMHFLMRARALVAFPGGFGTLDELFETLTLVQTGKVDRLPIILFGKDFWTRLVVFDFLVDEGTISAKDLELFRYAETAEKAWEIIEASEGL